MSDTRMGSDSVFTATAGIRFSDGTSQDTAASPNAADHINSLGIGGFHGPFLNIPATGSVNSPHVASPNQVRFIQFILPVGCVIGHLSYNVMAGDPGSHIGYGFYDSTKKLVLSSGALDCSLSVNGTATFTQVHLKPGIYYYAWTSSSINTKAHGYSAWNTDSEGLIMNTFAVRYGFAANPSVAGVLPATLGALTGDTSLNVINSFWEA